MSPSTRPEDPGYCEKIHHNGREAEIRAFHTRHRPTPHDMALALGRGRLITSPLPDKWTYEWHVITCHRFVGTIRQNPSGLYYSSSVGLSVKSLAEAASLLLDKHLGKAAAPTPPRSGPTVS